MSEFNNETNNEVSPFNEEGHYQRRRPVWAGVFVILIGIVLLLKQYGIIFPNWLFSWPVLLIVFGVYIGLKHNFRGGAWLALILIGTAFLIDDIMPGWSIGNYIWPLAIICIGLFLIFRPRSRSPFRHRCGRRHMHDERWKQYYPNDQGMAINEPNDYVDITSVFSSIKKMVVSKNFKGGDITNFMGGTEINLTQADIAGSIKIDATNIFGGTKLIVPPTWGVHSDVTSIFGGVEDKRKFVGENIDRTKIIYLDGTYLFGGIEIRSY